MYTRIMWFYKFGHFYIYDSFKLDYFLFWVVSFHLIYWVSAFFMVCGTILFHSWFRLFLLHLLALLFSCLPYFTEIFAQFCVHDKVCVCVCVCNDINLVSVVLSMLTLSSPKWNEIEVAALLTNQESFKI